MRVLVLGDSCSAGIGAAQAVYPAILHKSLDSAHRLENHAVPGLTSADAARYYHRAMVRHRWDFVIVYLGNTEASRSVYKGAYRRWRDMPGRSERRRAGQIVSIEQHENLIFSDRAEQFSVATTPQDFRKNLELIVHLARRHGTRVILINPIANGRFPAALMGSNAAFYKLVGLNARLADRLTGAGASAQALVMAIAEHEHGELAAAAERYRLLAEGDGQVRPIALNNLAVLLDQRDTDESPLAILKQLTEEPGATGAVAAYNLSRMLARRGQSDEANEYAALAVEQDSNLYRVKSAYRQQLAELSGYANVDVLDLAELLNSTDFIDYCHPIAEAHRTIAAAIMPMLTRSRGIGEREPDAGYVCVHPSPNTYLDFPTTMVRHFGIDCDIDWRDIQRAAMALLDRVGESKNADFLVGETRWPTAESDLQANIRNMSRWVAGHPLITSLDDLRQRLPAHGWEIGRFPEFYLDRVLHSYAAAAEVWRIDGLPESVAERWRVDSGVYQERLLPGLSVGHAAQPQMDRTYGRRVLAKVRAQLNRKTKLFEDSRATRIVTVKYWYLREAFRYGPHSRYGMLYPAWELEKLVEGLYVSLIIARRNVDTIAEVQAVSLLQNLARLHGVHEKFAARHVQDGFDAGSAEYQAELAALWRLFNENVRRTGDPKTAP